MLEDFFILLDHLIEAGGIVFANRLLDIQDANRQGACTEGDIDSVTHLDIVRCFRRTTVDRDMGSVAGVVCNGAALDDARNLEVLVQSHIS